MRPDQLETRLRERLDALGAIPRAELLHVLMLPDSERGPTGSESSRAPRRAKSIPRIATWQGRNPRTTA